MPVNTLPEWLQKDAAGRWLVRVWAQPGAKRSEIVGELDGCLKIRLAAPAVENKANKALLDFLGQCLNVRAKCLSLAKGDKSRRKTVCVTDADEQTVAVLAQAAQNGCTENRTYEPLTGDVPYGKA